jgi:hypothetical protein
VVKAIPDGHWDGIKDDRIDHMAKVGFKHKKRIMFRRIKTISLSEIPGLSPTKSIWRTFVGPLLHYFQNGSISGYHERISKKV